MKRVIQGEKKTFTFRLTEKDEDGVSSAFDLTGNTEISVCFKHSGGTLQKNRVAAPTGVTVIGADTDGKIQAIMESTESDALPKTDVGKVQIFVTKGAGEVTGWDVENAFQIIEKVC